MNDYYSHGIEICWFSVINALIRCFEDPEKLIQYSCFYHAEHYADSYLPTWIEEGYQIIVTADHV